MCSLLAYFAKRSVKGVVKAVAGSYKSPHNNTVPTSRGKHFLDATQQKAVNSSIDFTLSKTK